ncbi:MAG TPA: hypothetical protein V6C85_15430 [Allocoleopsis sp.]
MTTPADRPLQWTDVVQPDAENPTQLESQESEKERVYGYLADCQAKGIEPNSFNNWQSYQSQQ